jgi:acyl-CoA synthetase (AMP-forming)/AMP-acid ligase II
LPYSSLSHSSSNPGSHPIPNILDSEGQIHDIANLQFTSGTTGLPKAASLTHHNLLNNGRFIGARMALTPSDILCCPPPLFHCFGYVLGLLAVVTHGAKIVFPGASFDAKVVLRAVMEEGCTALHGVPAMFSAVLDELSSLPESESQNIRLRTGIGAGSPVPKPLMEKIRNRLKLEELTITYGMTETSPASFMTLTTDPLEKRLATVGRILPHTSAKIVDPQTDQIVPLGEKGGLCVAGYALHKGYWKDPKKTAEAMKVDAEGVRWMHTGDEAVFDEDGYCTITGRIKDIIIRGKPKSPSF